MANDPVPVPQTLADLRRAAGLTQAQVAARMGVGDNRVNQIEATYPNVRYDTLTRYVGAIGGGIQIVVGHTRVFADQLVPDPAQQGTREYLLSRSGRGGNVVYVPSAEELPLQGEASDPGGDDSGRDVDHADAEGDQGDGGQGEKA